MKTAHLDKKHHHYVPSIYMKGFVAPSERIFAYRKDNPEKPLHLPPENIAFENYYYSFDRPDGARDNHQWEDLFSTFEDRWPDVLKTLRKQDHTTLAANWFMFGFIAAMRARVPAAREFNAGLMAVDLRQGVKSLAAIGKLPAQLKRYEHELDTVPVGINPQRTIAKMTDDMRAFGDLSLKIGFEVLHNRTGQTFITSDNPVTYFDPKSPEYRMTPYTVEDTIEFFFPISHDMALRGSHKLKPYSQVVRHREVFDDGVVRKINRITARFGYRLILAANRSVDRLVKLHAASSPVLWTEVRGTPRDIQIHYGHRFGERPSLSKYVADGERLRFDQDDESSTEI